MQVVLVMFRAGGEKRSFSVTRDVTIIGRREDCDLRIPVSEVSRKHCRVIRDGETMRVEDLGSSNGTFHNGQRISGGVTLGPGDSIEVGPVVFVLQVDGVPADDELTPFKERAAHHLEEEFEETPPLAAADDLQTAEANLEAYEDSSPAPELLDEQSEPHSLDHSIESEPLSMDLSDESDATTSTVSHEREVPLSMDTLHDEDHGALPLSEHDELTEPLSLAVSPDDSYAPGAIVVESALGDESKAQAHEQSAQLDTLPLVGSSEETDPLALASTDDHELLPMIDTADEGEPLSFDLGDDQEHLPVSEGHDDSAPIELDLSDEHADHGSHTLLSEDDLLLDLNPIPETRKKR